MDDFEKYCKEMDSIHAEINKIFEGVTKRRVRENSVWKVEYRCFVWKDGFKPTSEENEALRELNERYEHEYIKGCVSR